MISFFRESTDFDIKHKNLIKEWLRGLAAEGGFKIGDLNYIFCSDDYLLEINKQYLGHDYYTDIITFDNREEEGGTVIDGDIFISVDTVRANGVEYGEGFDREIMRVVAHGLLHLIGFDDLDPEQQAEMRNQENKALEKWNSIMMS